MRAEFIEGMSKAACSVYVVTTDGIAGRRGVTVSAVSSVSADTPMPTLLTCIHHMSPAAAAMRTNRTDIGEKLGPPDVMVWRFAPFLAPPGWRALRLVMMS